ncbi:PLC-like phosphodiesterase [Mycena haematopus]|nr:PLC-like phosphodiesterase [Mycena haematopus]
MPSQHLLRRGLTSNDPLAPELSKELSHWERLIFSFDMENEQNDPNNNAPRQSQTADEIQTAALLAQLAASNGTMFSSPPGGPYSTLFQGHPSASGYNSGSRSFVSPAHLSMPYGSQPYPYFRGGPLPISQNPPSLPDTTRTRARSQSQAGPSTSNAAVEEDDNDEYDDKRRRNTAASARFRIKKKQKTLGLERTVSDLTGRAEELEREAADLRRENGWLKGHRGGRGNAVENTLPSFAWGLIDGSTTLELDNGVTKDGAVVVWHDEEIVASKCQDTEPAFSDDPAFPYVGKYIANLTLAQLKTLDCGSQRQKNFPLQLTYPGTRISTLQEVFDFIQPPDAWVENSWNIESKIDAVYPVRTASVEDFVQNQHAIFAASPYKDSITASYQSFDWRSLIAMKKLDPTITTSALVDYETAVMPDNTSSPWLGGLNLQNFSGSSLSVKLANAAHSINASILSPDAYDSPNSLTTREMVAHAHYLGMLVKPWTVNSLDMADNLLRWGVDGIITDYPTIVRRYVQQQGREVAPKFPKRRVLACLEEHNRW